MDPVLMNPVRLVRAGFLASVAVGPRRFDLRSGFPNTGRLVTPLRALLFGAVLVFLGLSPERASAQRQHTVRAGQSLSRIARRYHVDVLDLAAANRMRANEAIREGQVLTVPPRGVTYVRPGQTLSHVARAHECTVDELMRLNRIRAQGRLRAGQRLVLPGYEADAESTANRDWGTPSEPGVARIRRRDELVTVRLVDTEGRVTAGALESLATLMRRHELDPPELPHPRLALLLASISNHFGGREITLVSGRREAGGYTRESSRHTSGHATDIRVAGVPRRVLWDYCRSLSNTGCGYYPRSTFVHVDVRGQSAQWVDWSQPGARNRYGNLQGPWPRVCRDPRRRSQRRCSREGRRVSLPDDVPAEARLTDEAQRLLPAVPAIVAPSEADPEDAEYETAVDDDETDGRLDT
jgi:uncharacterized protein YcbK (DUF882 family)/LysM repeat protein